MTFSMNGMKMRYMSGRRASTREKTRCCQLPTSSACSGVKSSGASGAMRGVIVGMSVSLESGASGHVGEQRRVDPLGLPGRGPAFGERRVEQDLAVPGGGEPAVVPHLAVE